MVNLKEYETDVRRCRFEPFLKCLYFFHSGSILYCNYTEDVVPKFDLAITFDSECAPIGG